MTASARSKRPSARRSVNGRSLSARRLHGRDLAFHALFHPRRSAGRPQAVEHRGGLVRQRVQAPLPFLAPHEPVIGEEPQHAVRIGSARLGLGRDVPVRLPLEFQEHAPHECGVAVVALARPGIREVAPPVARRQNGAPHPVGRLVHDDPRRVLRISHGLASRHGCRQPGGPAAYDRNRFRFAHAASVHSLPAVIYARIRPTDQPEVECRRHRRLVGTASWR